MQNMMWAMTIVQKPSCRPTWRSLHEIVSSDAPRTTSGVAIGRKISRFVAVRPRNRCRTRANAIIVPSTVAMIVASTPTLMLVTSASHTPGAPQGFCQCLSVGKPTGFQTMLDLAGSC